MCFNDYGEDMNLMIIILMLIIPAIAQILVTTSYNKYKNIKNSNNIKGYEVARKILDTNGLKDIYVVEVKGNLTDHYDPKRKVVRLSTDIYHGDSIASIAVAAHECGHAIQDKEGYLYMRMRSLIYPVVNFTTSISYFIIFLGLFLESLDLIWLGIIFVGSGLVFQIVTLPVEINASKRAKIKIDEESIANTNEQDGIRNMLAAAASTYVAGVLSSALELLRLIYLFTDRRD
jgi:hypothetical protein